MHNMFANMIKLDIEVAQAEPQGFTNEEVIWASSHDWYVSICHLGELQGVKCFDSAENKLVEFYSLKALRDWAGY